MTALTDDVGTANSKGPVVDSNPVFDSAFTQGNAAKSTVLAVAPVVTDPVTSNSAPGDTYLVDWTFSWTFDEGEMLKAPFDIVLGMTDNGAGDRA